jgi:hypothetical protein
MELFASDDEAAPWQISEQILEDPVSGLTFQFEAAPSGRCHLRVFGTLPFGNREFIFQNGKFVASGCAIKCRTKPTWIMRVDL